MADDKKSSLKSSFDLAMERLAGRDGQAKSLSDQQKKINCRGGTESKGKGGGIGNHVEFASGPGRG